MRIKLLCLFVLITVLTGCIAGTPSGPPKPEFDEKAFDFGRMPAEAMVTHIYHLTNIGGDTVFIAQVRPHCGCTKAPMVDSVVTAGMTAPIELRYSAGGSRGMVSKSAAVRLRVAGSEVNEQLTFSTFIDTSAIAFSYGELGASPPKIQFSDSVETIKVKLVNRAAADRKVKVVDYQDDRVKLSWTEKKIPPKGDVELTVTRKVPAKEIIASITLEMEGVDNSRLTLPVLEYKPVTAVPAINAGGPPKPNSPGKDPWTNPKK